MSRSAKITVPFGDGKHAFLLDNAGLEELQEKTDFGPEEVYHRLGSHNWTLPCIQEPLRIGLVRAGMLPIKAVLLVERYAGPAYLMDAKPIAQMVVGAALIGAPDEDDPPIPGETGPGELTAGSPAPGDPACLTESGASGTSTASAE